MGPIDPVGPYAACMVIDGHQWLRRRLAALQEALRHEPSEERRAAIQEEIDRCVAELRQRRRRWWSRMGRPGSGF